MKKRARVKALGQHFLKNPAVLRKIVHQISPSKDDLIIEIGAGKGALTFPLAEQAERVVAVEKDPSLIPFLRKKNIPNLTILEKDILKVDFKQLTEKKSQKNVKLVGNLPYSLSSQILFKVLQERELFSECVFLIQKEVAERICGQPGSKNYAPLSILFQIYFLARIHFIVSPASFSPPPQVDSGLISLKKRSRPLLRIKNEDLFQKLLRGSFQHRRKTLFNNLKRFNFSLSLIIAAYQKFGLEKNLRPEQLTISQFVDLYNFFFPTEKKTNML